MTAITTICATDSITIITDGAYCSANGEVVFIAPKVFAMPHINAALALCGPGAFCSGIGALASYSAFTFDRMLELIVPIARQYVDQAMPKVASSPMAGIFELHIAGFSENRNRAEAYVLPGHDLPGSGWKSWQLNETTPGAVTPIPDADKLAAFGWRQPSADDFTAVDGIALMQAQRRVAGPLSGRIGGFIQHTVITRQSITTAIVHRWPEDVIGNAITPQ